MLIPVDLGVLGFAGTISMNVPLKNHAFLGKPQGFLILHRSTQPTEHFRFFIIKLTLNSDQRSVISHQQRSTLCYISANFF